jgi:hypothetical protein
LPLATWLFMVFVTLSLTIDSSIVLTQDNKKRTLKQPLRNIVGVGTAPCAVQAHAFSAWWNMYCFTKQKVWFYRFCPLAVLNPWPFVSRTKPQMKTLVQAALCKLYLNLISPDAFVHHSNCISKPCRCCTGHDNGTCKACRGVLMSCITNQNLICNASLWYSST